MQMDETVLRELDEQKILISDSITTCVHALGAVRKSDGSLRRLTDCKCPLGRSINSFMDTTCSTFSYLRLNTVAEYMTPDFFLLPWTSSQLIVVSTLLLEIDKSKVLCGMSMVAPNIKQIIACALA